MEATSSVTEQGEVVPGELLPSELLRELRLHRRVIAEAEVEELHLVHAWALSHPATGDVTVLSRDEFPGGDGTPGVAAFTAEPLAGALGVSPYAAQAVVADTLDLVHRLPRVWDQVCGLMVSVWKARRIAKATRHLSLEAVRWVDRQLVGAAGSIGTAALDRLIDLAVARVDPEGQREREAAERARWDVRLEHPRRCAGTSDLVATGDTVALGGVLDRVNADADALAQSGDTNGVGARRVKALVSLAREGAEQLVFGFAAEDDAAKAAGGGPEQVPAAASVSTTSGSLKLYVHTSLADLAAMAGGSTGSAVAEVERLGPITSELLKSWLGRTRASITPVLDLADATWAPRHDPPPRMREQVVLRHHGCVFPYCGRDARSGDLDHVEPWEAHHPAGSDGTAGTRPDNLAPLCRRHHRAKSDGRWRYEVLPEPGGGPPATAGEAPARARPPEHLWTGPHGETFLVTASRTVALGDP